MSKIQVYKLARKLGLSSKRVMKRLAKAGFSVKSHTSWVDEAVARAALSKAEISVRSEKEKVAGQPEPAPAPPKSEAPTEPPPEPERPPIEVHRLDTPVMEKPAPVGERSPPVPAEPAAATAPGSPKRAEVKEPVIPPVPKVVKIPERTTVKELSEKLATGPGEIIKKLAKMGILASLDQSLTPELVKQVAAELGLDVEVASLMEKPAPLEARGITQNIGLSGVELSPDPAKKFPGDRFVLPDTPGHDASTAMRTRGAHAADVVSSIHSLGKKVWLLAGAIVVMSLLTLVVPREKGTPSPEATPPVVDEGQKSAAIPPPKTEERPPRPSVQPREWKVLHHLPRAGQTEQSRRAVIQIFFNRPPDKDIAEYAFSILPYEPGTFSWSSADRLVYTPKDALLPATQYTVSLTPISGSDSEGEYTLLEARWSLTTGDARTYRQDIKPLIAAYCLKCHGPKGAAAGIPLKTYRDVSRYVVAGRSEKSRLYTFIRERQHHINMAGPNHSTTDKLAIIRDWIDEDGAEE